MSSTQKLSFKVPPPLRPKSSLITSDYDLSQKVLGVGINGKVLECTEKKTGLKYALKVSKLSLRFQGKLNWCLSFFLHDDNRCSVLNQNIRPALAFHVWSLVFLTS